MTENEYSDLAMKISFEFDRYVLEHPESDDLIPDNALIIYEVESNPEFSKWHRSLSLKQREENQAVVVVKVKDFPPERISLLENPKLELVSNI